MATYNSCLKIICRVPFGHCQFPWRQNKYPALDKATNQKRCCDHYGNEAS